MEYSFFLCQKRIAITEATNEFGRFLVSAFAEHKCKFFLIDRDEHELAKMANWVENTLKVDVDICSIKSFSFENIQILIDTIAAIGGVDILINNKEYLRTEGFISALCDTNELNNLLQRQLIYPVLVSQYLITNMFAHGHGWGRIVNLHSDAIGEGESEIGNLADHLILNIINLLSKGKPNAGFKLGTFLLPQKSGRDEFIQKLFEFIKEQK